MSKSDVFRSWIRQAADRAKHVALASRPVSLIRRAAQDVLRQQVEIPERAVAAAVAQTDGWVEVSVQMRQGAIRVVGTGTNSEDLSFALTPVGAFFAPRGAKELRFRVEPEERASRATVTDTVGRIGGLIAERLWGPILRSTFGETAQVTRDGANLSVDLRTIPSARRAQSTPTLAVALDVLEVADLWVDEGLLHLKLSLPTGIGR